MKNFLLKFRKIITSFLLIGVILVAYLLFFDTNIQIAEATWWNDGWYYRQAIEVTNNTNEENNVYIELTLDTDTASTSMQTDCGDFRFVSEEGDVLGYYIVSGCRTASNVIHINFSVLRAGKQVMYFYYSNPTVENGFSSSDFTQEASNYIIGTVQAQETGPGPVGYWPFNEGYGSVVHDESSGRYNGTITGATWQDASQCVVGKCLYFDGSDDYIDISTEPTVRAASDNKHTWSLWVKPLDVNSKQVIMSATDSNGFGDNNTVGEFNIGFSPGELRWSHADSGNDRTSISISTTTSWMYLVGIQDGNNVYLYVDGKLVDSSTGANPASDKVPLSFHIGRPHDALRYFKGYIDEVKIYPYARTADQIKQDYNAGLAGASVKSGTSASFGSQSDEWLSDGLVGHWKMDESATTSGAVDSSGNSNNGIYYGSASITAGKFGRGGVFDGDGDYITVSTSPSFDSMEELTYSAWVKTGDTTGGKTLISFRSSADDSIYFDIDPQEDNLRIYNDIDNANDGFYSSSVVSLSDKMHHVVWIVDSERKTSIYYDGEKVLNNQQLSTGLATLDDGFFIYIGTTISGANPFSGQLDEVRVYNRALSVDEVKKLYEWAPGPVMHLKIDEKQGANVYDSSGYGNNGIINGAQWGTGKNGSALDFDTGSDYINLNSPDSLDNLPAMTIEAWVYPRSLGTSDSGVIVSKGISNGNWEFTYNSNNQLRFYKDTDNVANFYAYSENNVINLNKWQHVSFTWDGTVDYAKVKFFVNGISGNTSGSAAGSLISDAARNLTIGNYEAPFINFDGMIDEVKIYNYVRTQKQILEDMHNGNPIKGAVLDLSFDEGYGGIAHDSSDYTNNGLLQPGTGGTNTASSAMWSLDGKKGRALEFDGTDDYIDIGSDIIGTGAVSICAWIKMDTFGEIAGRIADNGVMFFNPTNTNDRFYFSSNGTDRAESANDSAVLKVWQHVCAARTASGTANIYVDAKLSGEADQDSGTPAAGANNLIIGNRLATDRTFDGLIDEVKIFNYALTEDDVKIIYNSGASAVMGGRSTASDGSTKSDASSREYCVPGDASTCDPPVLELKLDEKTGTTTFDTSGQGSDGIFVNSASSPGWRGAHKCKLGNCLEFDGINDYISVGSIYNGVKTVSFWLKADSANEKVINLSELKNIEVVSGEITANNFVSPTIYTDSVISSSIDTSWHYITITTGTGINASGVDIGKIFSDYFKGFIDHIHFYNYERTPAQIAWDYNRGKPIAHWSFNECQGGTIYDESGNGNNGTLYLGATGVTATGTCASSSDSFWYNGLSGKLNGSGSFDNSDDYIRIPNNDVVDSAEQLSLCAWVYHDDLDADDFIFHSNSNSANSGFKILRDNVGFNGNADTYSIVVKEGGSDQSTAQLSGSANLSPSGQWTHVCGVYTENISNGLKLFVNGTFDNQTDTIGQTDINAFDQLGVIGGYGSAGSFDGKIDEVKIWNYALTAEQVKTEYNGGAIKFGN